MPLGDELMKKAAELSDMAIVVIGRTAGEDQDTRAERRQRRAGCADRSGESVREADGHDCRKY